MFKLTPRPTSLKSKMSNSKSDISSSIENIFSLFKANIVGQTKEAEEKARKMLNEAADKSNVEFSHFKNVVSKMAEDNKTKAEDMFTKLSTNGLKFISALKAGMASAVDAGMSSFKEGMK